MTHDAKVPHGPCSECERHGQQFGAEYWRDMVTGLLSAVYDPEDAQIWMESPNQMLGGISPSQAIESGRGFDVVAMFEAIADGAFV